MKKNTIIAVVAALAALAGVPAMAGEGPEAWQWNIGPVIKGKNYSVNMPRTMYETREGPAFDFPYPTKADGHVHYITVPVRSLQGAQRISLTYRIDAKRGTRFIPQEYPDHDATLSLYFQRAGDRWSRKYPRHRWYSPNDRVMRLTPGTHTVSISLDEPWIAVLGGNNKTHPREFAAALNDTMRLGFTFGSSSGRGHGVYATGPARFTVLDFRIE